MPTLTYTTTSSTRINALTNLSVTTKVFKPKIDGAELRHQYAYDGSVTDAAAVASMKADLEGPKGYGALVI